MRSAWGRDSESVHAGGKQAVHVTGACPWSPSLSMVPNPVLEFVVTAAVLGQLADPI